MNLTPKRMPVGLFATIRRASLVAATILAVGGPTVLNAQSNNDTAEARFVFVGT